MSRKKTKVAWTPETLALLGKIPDGEVAHRVGCTYQAVGAKRLTLGIKALHHYNKWGETDLGLLRSYSDEEIAKMTGRMIADIAAKRKEVSQRSRASTF